MTTETIANAVPTTRAVTFRRAIAVALGAALVAMSAQFEVLIPGSPIPETLQGGALLLVGMTLGPRLGATALVTYLLAGAAGMPVYSGGGLGLLHLFGPTGGYLLAFPLGAFTAGWVAVNAGIVMTPVRYLIASAAGMAVVHLGGWAWLSVVTGDPTASFAMGIVPFGLSDFLELTLAASVAMLAGPRVRRAL